MADQRRAPRVETALVVAVTARRRRVTFRIDDLSTSGARISGALTLVLGKRIRISLTFEGITVESDAEVVRIHTADLLTDQAAVRFLAVSATFHDVVDRYVSSLLDDDQRTTGSIPRISSSTEPS